MKVRKKPFLLSVFRSVSQANTVNMNCWSKDNFLPYVTVLLCAYVVMGLISKIFWPNCISHHFIPGGGIYIPFSLLLHLVIVQTLNISVTLKYLNYTTLLKNVLAILYNGLCRIMRIRNLYLGFSASTLRSTSLLPCKRGSVFYGM
jgi:hypothetical protein